MYDTKLIVQSLRDELLKGNAHVTFEEAIRNLPAEKRGEVPENMPYSIWQLVGHIRMTQWDILDFSRNPHYKELSWPHDYWPKERAPKNEDAWKKCIHEIKEDLHAFIALLEAPDAKLFEPFAHGDGQHLFREALLIIDHNSYHVGEIVALRRLLGVWHG
ncbi:DinB family protein [Chitinophaga sp. Cy-1792]|uniref:DinB family protein n=1 Tax=Chitinophaga sp. Cy-1792 TaxID=2608339 RepID=UPI0014231871|nr:DinB family protein [Chitinophaga sp. Cy-1792]NIG54354.1 DinB family protein [Chitinophaga sp. Cy-1792]